MIAERYVNAAVLVLLLAVPLWALAADEPFTITLATRAAIFALAAVGLNIALGLGGLVSLGHAVFFGIGGYSMGILAYHAQTYTPLLDGPLVIAGTNSMPVIWLVAMLTSALAALLIGLLSLRTAGVYFIMITLAFGQMFYFFSISWSTYGGEDGLSIYVRNQFPGINTLVPINFFAICFGLLCTVLFFNALLARSPFGLALNAARQTPQRVQTIGLDPTRLKLVAFVISGVITGLAGALFADLNRFVSPTMFSWQMSGEIMVFVILGGVARLCGPVVGAVTFVMLEHFLGGLSEYWHIYLGALLLLIVLFARGGLVGLVAGRGVAHD
ncbi:branched-chain amino acid ABC transporter permease [Sulfitobacter guttiformis]|uniref:Amino acid/amide ABC transporter membrane protein 2 (HAAT family) n=1 Tax=Sulfitobacter guttiformis TaxID=74349 RepID=J7FW37_9RHOB|nr:branched-chain amino acid ABC transporter permease [Sulfitobacter guttiformis]AFP55383.1 branched-chain amino acid ABC transporter, permease protein LivM [Sulfitobacter guttiformis]KIN75537.1 Branched-chain amino acid ABC transporter, permease protein LivM [Sulfitobacter guttiformis KCTC 32187]RKE91048.1 amino acid/amide ABC transporter membrane protein 2 (HAAT family) [Sulfitobacter guttiformis]